MPLLPEVSKAICHTMIGQAFANSFSMFEKVLALGMIATGTTMSHMQTLFVLTSNYILNIFFFLGIFMSK